MSIELIMQDMTQEFRFACAVVAGVEVETKSEVLDNHNIKLTLQTKENVRVTRLSLNSYEVATATGFRAIVQMDVPPTENFSALLNSRKSR